MKALSLRQPWAWLLVEGIKPVENRRWNTRYRGRFYVHAAKGMSRGEYEDCEGFCAGLWSGRLPPFEELVRGGIVGSVELTDVLDKPSGIAVSGARRWQMPHQYGFLVREPRRIPFVECKGALSFWRVPPAVRVEIYKRVTDEMWAGWGEQKLSRAEEAALAAERHEIWRSLDEPERAELEAYM